MFFNFNKCMLLSIIKVLLRLRARNGTGGVAGQLGPNGARIGCLFGVVMIKFYLPCVGGKLLYRSSTGVAATLGCSVRRRGELQCDER